MKIIMEHVSKFKCLQYNCISPVEMSLNNNWKGIMLGERDVETWKYGDMEICIQVRRRRYHRIYDIVCLIVFITNVINLVAFILYITSVLNIHGIVYTILLINLSYLKPLELVDHSSILKFRISRYYFCLHTLLFFFFLNT